MFSQDYYGFQVKSPRGDARPILRRTQLSQQKLNSKSKQKQKKNGEDNIRLQKLKQKYSQNIDADVQKKIKKNKKDKNKCTYLNQQKFKLFHYDDRGASNQKDEIRKRVQKRALESLQKKLAPNQQIEASRENSTVSQRAIQKFQQNINAKLTHRARASRNETGLDGNRQISHEQPGSSISTSRKDSKKLKTQNNDIERQSKISNISSSLNVQKAKYKKLQVSQRQSMLLGTQIIKKVQGTRYSQNQLKINIIGENKQLNQSSISVNSRRIDADISNNSLLEMEIQRMERNTKIYGNSSKMQMNGYSASMMANQIIGGNMENSSNPANILATSDYQRIKQLQKKAREQSVISISKSIDAHNNKMLQQSLSDGLDMDSSKSKKNSNQNKSEYSANRRSMDARSRNSYDTDSNHMLNSKNSRASNNMLNSKQSNNSANSNMNRIGQNAFRYKEQHEYLQVITSTNNNNPIVINGGQNIGSIHLNNNMMDINDNDNKLISMPLHSRNRNVENGLQYMQSNTLSNLIKNSTQLLQLSKPNKKYEQVHDEYISINSGNKYSQGYKMGNNGNNVSNNMLGMGDIKKGGYQRNAFAGVNSTGTQNIRAQRESSNGYRTFPPPDYDSFQQIFTNGHIQLTNQDQKSNINLNDNHERGKAVQNNPIINIKSFENKINAISSGEVMDERNNNHQGYQNNIGLHRNMGLRNVVSNSNSNSNSGNGSGISNGVNGNIMGINNVNIIWPGGNGQSSMSNTTSYFRQSKKTQFQLSLSQVSEPHAIAYISNNKYASQYSQQGSSNNTNIINPNIISFNLNSYDTTSANTANMTNSANNMKNDFIPRISNSNLMNGIQDIKMNNYDDKHNHNQNQNYNVMGSVNSLGSQNYFVNSSNNFDNHMHHYNGHHSNTNNSISRHPDANNQAYSLTPQILAFTNHQQQHIINLYSGFGHESHQLQDFMDRVYDHLAAINRILDFVMETQQFYTDQNQKQIFHICMYMLIGKFYKQRVKVIRALKLAQSCFCLSHKQIHNQELNQFINSAPIIELTQYLEQGNKLIFGILIQFYTRIVANGDHLSQFISSPPSPSQMDKWVCTSSFPSSQKSLSSGSGYRNSLSLIVDKLNQQFELLIAKIDLNQHSYDNSYLKDSQYQAISLRAFTIMELLFLLSELEGRKVKVLEKQDFQPEDFEMYCKKWYSLFKQTVLYFH